MHAPRCRSWWKNISKGLENPYRFHLFEFSSFLTSNSNKRIGILLSDFKFHIAYYIYVYLSCI